MDKEKIYERISTLLSDDFYIEKEKITPESRFIEDLQIDSLSMAQLVMAIEEELGTQIADDEIAKLTDVRETVDFIYRKYLEKHDAT